MNKIKNTKGITLIALIITIIILLILAGVAINAVIGENGIIGIAKWSNFVSEYTTVREQIELYKTNELIQNRTKIEEDNDDYPIKTGEHIGNNSIENTLKETIKYTESIEEITDENVKLFKIDMNLLNLNIQNEYVINIKTGELYRIKGEQYQGKTYHRLDCGVKKTGEVEDHEEEETPPDTEDTIYLKIDQEKILTTRLQEGEVEWVTSDESVVTVDQEGKIKGIAKGEATITISYKTEDTGETQTGSEIEEAEANIQTYKVIVEGGIPKNITLTVEDKTIYEYQTDVIHAKINGKIVGTGYLIWETSDESIVKVDINGKVKGIAKGEATITCKWKEDETIQANCKVTVEENNSLIIDKTRITITIGQKGKIIAKQKNQIVTNLATWESEDESIATVNKGQIEAKAIGETNIIVKYQGATKVCKIIVKDLIEEIYTIEDLSLLASQVESGIKFEGRTVTLMNDLDFKDEGSYESTESKEYTNYYTNTTTWERIGITTTKCFNGTFNGDGNTISKLNINAKEANQGLFGYSQGGTFKNIILKDVEITSTSGQAGGILGGGNNISIANCKVTGHINTIGQVNNESRTGGIVGFIGTAGGNISNCINEAIIEGTSSGKGGIIGRIYKGTVTNCTNKGNIISKGDNAGGIVGRAGINTNANYTGTITKCKNYGQIEGKHSVGGIAGGLQQSSSIVDSTNYLTGTIHATGQISTDRVESAVGGIVGEVSYFGYCKVENCNNYANVSGEYNGVGGISGIQFKGSITNCKNEGVVVGTRANVGGIAGYIGYDNIAVKIYTKGTIENCINKGDITGSYNIGGISGINYTGAYVRNCNNYGSIIAKGKNTNGTGESNAGGISGQMSIRAYDGIACITENCNNYGTVNCVGENCGGIIGVQRRGDVINCKNEAAITGQHAIGGICGFVGYTIDSKAMCNGTVKNCINKGNLTDNEAGNRANIGGIAGVITYGSSITTSANKGNIELKGNSGGTEKASRAGGIVGSMTNMGANSVKYCYNTGNVTTESKWIGGIAGILNNKVGQIDHCYSIGKITGPANIGGILGYNGGGGTISNCYYLQIENDAGETTNGVIPTIGTPNGLGAKTNDQSVIKNLYTLEGWSTYFKEDRSPYVNDGFPILNGNLYN